MGVGDKLRALRKKLGLTQKEFASRIPGKVDYTYIGKLERGEQYPSLKMLEKIGRSFSVPLSYFFEDDSITGTLDFFPEEIKDLLKDKKRQELLKSTELLDDKDLYLVKRIVDVLVQSKMQPTLQVLEKGGKYRIEEKESLISRIRQALSSPATVLSLKEPWVRKVFRLALATLEEEEK